MRSPSSHGSSDADFADFLENELELAIEEVSDRASPDRPPQSNIRKIRSGQSHGKGNSVRFLVEMRLVNGVKDSVKAFTLHDGIMSATLSQQHVGHRWESWQQSILARPLGALIEKCIPLPTVTAWTQLHPRRARLPSGRS